MRERESKSKRGRERERPSTSEQCYVSGTIAIRVNKLWSVCHIHEAARVHQPRSTLLSVSSPLRRTERLRAFPSIQDVNLVLQGDRLHTFQPNRTEPILASFDPPPPPVYMYIYTHVIHVYTRSVACLSSRPISKFGDQDRAESRPDKYASIPRRTEERTAERSASQRTYLPTYLPTYLTYLTYLLPIPNGGT